MSEDVLHLTAVLVPRGPAAAIVLDDEQVASLGGTKTPPVRFTIGGTTVRGRIGRMGGENLLGFNKSVRAQLRVEAGDTVDLIIELDTEPREVDLPPALAEALDADRAVRSAFDALSPSRRKEHARSVSDAKREDTRDRRIAAIVSSLRGHKPSGLRHFVRDRPNPALFGSSATDPRFESQVRCRSCPVGCSGLAMYLF